MRQSVQSRYREIAATAGIALAVSMVVGAGALNARRAKNVAASGVPRSAQTQNVNYKDGTYTARGSYQSPGGRESIVVQVTLMNNIVTATSAQSAAKTEVGKAYQSQFISGYRQQVVGKPIAKLNLDRVSGSSLTSQGFNDAIRQIEKQAQA